LKYENKKLTEEEVIKLSKERTLPNASKKERTITQLQDMQSFIECVLDNPTEFGASNRERAVRVLETIIHDTQGIVMKEPGFLPRTAGYRTAQAIDSKPRG